MPDISLAGGEQDTLRKAVYGAVNLVAIAYPGPVASAKANTAGALVLANTTGAAGQLLADKGTITYTGKSTAEIAGEVLPALTATVTTLQAKAPAEAEEFRRAVTTAVNQAAAAIGPNPARADMIAKITAALEPAPEAGSGCPGTARRLRTQTLPGKAFTF